MKKILSLILLSFFVASLKADDTSWKIHPIFDEEVTHVVETPSQVYFTSKNIMNNKNTESFLSLFRYDKKGEELTGLSFSNILNGYDIRDVIYNPDKGYLAVLYKDFNIDFIYNDGKVVNIPYYEQASLSFSKGVNCMTLDPANDRLYLATDFGYVAINDKKHEIAESRIYGEPFEAFFRLGDNYVAIMDHRILYAPVNSPRLSLEEYSKGATFDYPAKIYTLGDKTAILTLGNTQYRFVKKLVPAAAGVEISDLFEGVLYNLDYNAKGLTVAKGNDLYLFSTDGSMEKIERPESFRGCAATSANLSEIWNGMARKGLNSIKKTGEEWSVTRDWMAPNAPASYASTSYLNHPQKGFLMLDYGYFTPTKSLDTNTPLQLSAYNNGRWTNLAPAYTNPDRTSIATSTNGMLIDPDNNSYLYITSYHNGILRLNLNNPQDIIHLSHPNDADAGKDGFVILDYVPEKNRGYSNISAPYYDKWGNMWMYFANWDDTSNPKLHFYCWTAADRKATTSAADVKMPKHVEFDIDFPVNNLAHSLPLVKSGSGLIVCAASQYEETLVVVDTKGTPLDTSDDQYYRFPTFSDGDGNKIDLSYIAYMWEDPSTGYVWLCHINGVCYFVPSQLAAGNYTLHRVKVSRNDGTNLADYLLEGVAVNGVTSDAEGRKWFATAGGGIICTTSDGREILEEFNTSNSPLPDDVVYGIGYNSAANSLMISTAQGYAEYMLPMSQSSSTKADVKAYPNPVRPTYSGYVTITDIPQGSFVKIADSAGNLVKDLGIMAGFEMLWDLSDSNFNRVKSGVYHILISPSDETSKYSTVGKILVIS